MVAFIDITGKRFSRLVVIARAPNRNGLVMFDCLCDCGKSKTVSAKTLRNGGTKSCGCMSIENALNHVRSNEKPIGYKRIHKQSGRPEIKTESGFVREHVYVMEQMLGRKLDKGEVVHHKDHNKLNNDPSNLELMTHAEHTIHHNSLREFSPSTRSAISKANSKYTMDEAKKLRSMVENGISQRQAALQLNISQMAASRIVRNITYKD